MPTIQLPSPLQVLHHHPGKEKDIRIFMKRDDLIHPDISGNKWRKLKYNIEIALEQKFDAIVSWGGAWSNHLAALAAAGEMFNIQTVGIVRGEEPKVWGNTLHYCTAKGMHLYFISRSEFDSLPESAGHILGKYKNMFIIPLGGEGELGVEGCSEIIGEIDVPYQLVCVPVGTGTTLKGLAGSNKKVDFIGFSALKESKQHSLEFSRWVDFQPHVELTHEYSMGGFAKSNRTLEDFIINFYQQNKIMLEPVYTGKMMYGLFDRIEKGQIKENTNIICIHTGGLQGLNGFPDLHSRLFTS